MIQCKVLIKPVQKDEMPKRPNVNDYAWVLRGKQRKKIIKIMDEPKIPTEVKEETHLSLNNVSDILRSFEKRKLARCLNPKDKTGRLYELTEQGKIIRDKIRGKSEREKKPHEY